MTWNSDMSAAPRDGTPVLAAFETKDGQRIAPVIWRASRTSGRGHLHGWHLHRWVDLDIEFCVTPIAWMPHPPKFSPPQETEHE